MEATKNVPLLDGFCVFLRFFQSAGFLDDRRDPVQQFTSFHQKRLELQVLRVFSERFFQNPNALVEPRLALGALCDTLQESSLLLPGAFVPDPFLLSVNLLLDLLAQLE